MDQQTLSYIHRDGWRFVAAFAIVSIMLAFLHPFLGWVGCLLTCWCLFFFRDPPRVIPRQDGILIAPADGHVCAIVEETPPEELGLEGTWQRISIFLNIFDGHINRIPMGGKILRRLYRPGAFFNASLDKASKDNERMSLVIASEQQPSFHYAVVQIAGLIARRIVCDVSEGEDVATGSTYGLIRFGSRVDVYIPTGVRPKVLKGQKMVGGETILAEISVDEMRQIGEK